MGSIADNAVVGGDRWLSQATDTYRNGGSHQSAAAEGILAVGYYLQAIFDLLERRALVDEKLVDEAMRRHPAGRKRNPGVVAEDKEGGQPRQP